MLKNNTNKFVFIRVAGNTKRFINKCNKNNIELYHINYINNDELKVKIKLIDLKNIKIYNYYSEISIVDYTGLKKIVNKVLNNKLIFITFIFCLITMYLISNIIVRIDIIHSNKEVRGMVKEELLENGIKELTLKKDFKTLENIKNNILTNNKNTLEWLSINRVGMIYEVRIEERIIKNEKQNNKYCNIISNKESTITNIYYDTGELLVDKNDLVKKGTVLISGDIKLNEEIKNNVCASGKVYGDVWYNTNVTISLFYKEKTFTKKERYNLEINNKILKKPKYKLYNKDYLINTKLIKLYKEKEYKLVNKKYSEKESIDKALETLSNRVKTKLNNKGYIKYQKVLKKEINDSTIYIEVFIITNELISKQVIE